MLSPDQWCMFDSTKAGLHRMYEQGITKYAELAAIQADRFQVAIEQLPEVSCISQQVLVCSGTLSSALLNIGTSLQAILVSSGWL